MTDDVTIAALRADVEKAREDGRKEVIEAQIRSRGSVIAEMYRRLESAANKASVENAALRAAGVGCGVARAVGGVVTYDPRADEHPVAQALRGLGELTLVGSRAFRASLGFASPASDWDYYLTGTGCTEGEIGAEQHRIGGALMALGFEPLPGEGGPYGRDDEIDRIWRLPALTAYGRDWPHVDVIVCSSTVAARRLPTLERIARLGARGGALCGALKSGQAWGTFWLAMGRGR